MTLEATVLTLQVFPHDSATEKVIRDLGANPKNVMRLMNTEPVSKLHDYLIKKWKLSEMHYDLILHNKGHSMCLNDVLSAYQDSSVAVKVLIEYELVSSGDDSTTAGSTPVAATPEPQAAPNVDSILQEIQHLASLQALNSDQVVTLTISPKKPLVDQPIKVIQPVTKETIYSSNEVSQEPLPLSVPALSPDSLILAPLPVSSDHQRIETIYKEMLDREKDLFMSILDSQARWLAQMQNQMVSTCLAVQEKAFNKLLNGTLTDTDDNTPRLDGKKQRRQK